MKRATEELRKIGVLRSTRDKLREIGRRGPERRLWAIVARLVDAEYERLEAEAAEEGDR